MWSVQSHYGGDLDFNDFDPALRSHGSFRIVPTPAAIGAGTLHGPNPPREPAHANP
jgi:hypothetical protein